MELMTDRSVVAGMNRNKIEPSMPTASVHGYLEDEAELSKTDILRAQLSEVECSICSSFKRSSAPSEASEKLWSVSNSSFKGDD